jgi:hypothetical protein
LRTIGEQQDNGTGGLGARREKRFGLPDCRTAGKECKGKRTAEERRLRRRLRLSSKNWWKDDG